MFEKRVKAMLLFALWICILIWASFEMMFYIQQNSVEPKSVVVEQMQPPVYVNYSDYLKTQELKEAQPKSGQVTISGEVPAQTLIIEGDK